MTSFEALELSAPLLRAVEGQGFAVPTAIQSRAIPHLLAGRDMMGTAQTGQGKTAAYLLPILHRLAERGEASETPIPRKPRVLILAPTRELASQIGDFLRQFSKGMRLYYTVIYGGTRFVTQQRVLERGVHILVATPGRMMDHIRRRTLVLDRVDTFVLDEADRMLDMGFVDEVKEVARSLPVAHQTIMFSATMNRGVRSLAAGLLHNPELIEVGTENTVAANVDHRVMRVKHADKKPLLMHLLARPDVARVLVFTRTKAMADVLAGEVRDAGHKADAIHGDREQSVRSQVLGDFRRGALNVLIATDVAARGIDVPDITHVINYDMPVESDGYVHRVGRTGRAGAKGTALSICASGEGNLLRLVEQAIGQSVPVDMDHPFHDAHAHDRPASGQKRRRFDGNKRSAPFKKPDGSHRNGARPFKRHESRAQEAVKADVPQKKRVDILRAHEDAKPRGEQPHRDRPAQGQAKTKGKRTFDGGFKPLRRTPRKA
jgi:ATP-dependent RNA helicase RhlE